MTKDELEHTLLFFNDIKRIQKLSGLREHDEYVSKQAQRIIDALSPQWIDVNDRLPKETVIAAGVHGKIMVGWVSRQSDGEFVCATEHEYLPEVTHWMPLPTTKNNQP